MAKVTGLTWLPWIGVRYQDLPASRRLLIVGESHYSNETEAAKIAAAIDEIISRRDYTRAVVSECCIDQDWRNKTLDALPKLFFRTSAINRQAFWADICFYNFVQRPMRFNSYGPERPSFTDFVDGWGVFARVVEILRPSCCVFIGVEAANSFNFVMGERCPPIRSTERIGRTSARTTRMQSGEHGFPVHFVQHAGKFFSWSQWHEYLKRHCVEIGPILDDPRYAAPSD